ncbi:MAG: GGDEF domain-containing protein, partial [Oscillospiraceae bacterium]
NDSWGHIVGDTAITHVANVIKSHFNETDFIGRFGGDEFIVLLTTPVTKIDIEKKCEELNQSIRIPFNFNGKDYKSLCNMADKALYTSKSKGRNTYTIYDSTLKI